MTCRGITGLISVITARKRSLRRLCFYTCPSFCPQGGGGIPGQVPPPRTRYTPRPGTPPPPRTPGTRYTPSPRNRYTPRTRYTPPRPGTPPGPGTPPDQYTPPPRSSACWEIRATSGRYASYWNAFLFFHQIKGNQLNEG